MSVNDTSRLKQVEIGGIDGYSDLAQPENFSDAVATGRASLYLHANGVIDEGGGGLNAAIGRAWVHTGPASAEFGPYPASWFAPRGATYTYPIGGYFHYWTDSGLAVDRASVNVSFDSPTSLSDWTHYVDAARAAGVQTLAPVGTPNNTGDLYNGTNASLGSGFFDPKWDTVRAMALYGGGLTIDSPPVFFYQHSTQYQEFVEQEIRWANQNGLTTSVIVSPFDSKLGFLSYAQRFVADLAAANALPNSWIVENYDEFQDGTYPTDGTPNYLNPIGSETTPGTIASVANWLAHHAPTTVTFAGGGVRVQNADGSFGAVVQTTTDGHQTTVVDATGTTIYRYDAAGAQIGIVSPPSLTTQAPSIRSTPVTFASGAGQATSPGGLFDATFYLAENPDVAASGMSPLVHYEEYGWHEGRNPDALFDSSYYLSHNPDVAAAGVDPLLHYEMYGSHEGRDPSALFGNNPYLAANPDVRAAGVDPLLHFINYGQTEGRMTFLPDGTAFVDPLVDANFYDAQAGISASSADPNITAHSATMSYASTGWQHGLNPDAWFDTTYYLAHNPDVAASGVNPLAHYEQYGWHEGRNPSAQFSTNGYLDANLDIRAAAINPLQHYVQFGNQEGRAIFNAS